MASHRVKSPPQDPYKEITEVECYLCKKEYMNFRSVRSHMTSIHTKLSKRQIEKLREKKRKLERESMKPCQICNRKCIEKKHSCADLKLACEYCSKSFKTLHRLKTHLDAEHADRSIYICDVCGKEFEMIAFMEHHRKMHKPGCFKCPKCPEKLDTIYQKRKHMAMHAKDRG